MFQGLHFERGQLRTSLILVVVAGVLVAGAVPTSADYTPGAVNATSPPEPVLKPVRAVFKSVPAGQSCHPPYCTTTYTERATGESLHYAWTVSIRKDPNCGKGFQPNEPTENRARWYHADESEGGTCNHSGTDYDASGFGHPGLVTVTVSNGAWSCVATFYGTQGPEAQPRAVGPKPHPCKLK